eukprot:s421_g9.t1
MASASSGKGQPRQDRDLLRFLHREEVAAGRTSKAWSDWKAEKVERMLAERDRLAEEERQIHGPWNAAEWKAWQEAELAENAKRIASAAKRAGEEAQEAELNKRLKEALEEHKDILEKAKKESAQQRALADECEACRYARAELEAERELRESEISTLQLVVRNATLELRNSSTQYEIMQVRVDRLNTELVNANLEVEVMQMRMNELHSEFDMERNFRYRG